MSAARASQRSHPVDVGQDRPDLVREEVGQREDERHAHGRVARVALVAQDAGGDDRHLLRDRQAQTAEQQGDQDACVREPVDELLENEYGLDHTGVGKWAQGSTGAKSR